MKPRNRASVGVVRGNKDDNDDDYENDDDDDDDEGGGDGRRRRRRHQTTYINQGQGPHSLCVSTAKAKGA